MFRRPSPGRCTRHPHAALLRRRTQLHRASACVPQRCLRSASVRYGSPCHDSSCKSKVLLPLLSCAWLKQVRSRPASVQLPYKMVAGSLKTTRNSPGAPRRVTCRGTGDRAGYPRIREPPISWRTRFVRNPLGLAIVILVGPLPGMQLTDASAESCGCYSSAACRITPQNALQHPGSHTAHYPVLQPRTRAVHAGRSPFDTAVVTAAAVMQVSIWERLLDSGCVMCVAYLVVMLKLYW